MKYARVAFLFFLISSAAVAADAVPQSPQAEWFQCAAQLDCTFVPGICTDNTVVNRKYEKIYGQMVAQTKIKCDKIEPRMADAVPDCVQGYCVMRLPRQLTPQ